uniref:Centrosomal AT-AC splicing factor n=1 Tax=Cyprinus carpio carpio TaxID=630221 RepID=A0A8C1E155_CYPCA
MLLQVKEAKRTIKSPQVEKYSPDHDEKFWCYCCVLEMQKHVTDCNISVLYGGLLEHKSTPEHRTNTHKFWWDYKADPELRDKFIITEEETPRDSSLRFPRLWNILRKKRMCLLNSCSDPITGAAQTGGPSVIIRGLFSWESPSPDPDLVHPAEVDQHSSKHTARTRPAVEMFILELYHRGYWRSVMKPQAVDSRKLL